MMRPCLLMMVTLLAASAGCAGPPNEIVVDLGSGATLQMVLVPAGSFVMGSPASETDRDQDEGPAHHVTIIQPFYIGKFEITQRQWTAVMGQNPSRIQNPLVTTPDSPADLPVEEVSWLAASEFVERLSTRAGGRFSLPTEAQWEYAARAGTQTAFSFGDDPGELGEYAWHDDNALRRPHPVGTKKPNAWGLYDVHGNVWEWCRDGFQLYESGPQFDPTGAEPPTAAVLRGGAWEDPPHRCRSAYRLYTYVNDSGDGTGLRVVKSLK